MPPVHEAAVRNDVATLRRLLDENPGLLEAKESQYGARPLHCASRAGSLEAVQLLLGRGAGIDTPDWDRATALMWACETGRAAVVAHLLAAGADPTLRSYSLGWTPLIHAVYYPGGSGQKAVIRLLLKDGRVDVNAGGYEQTALWYACYRGSVRCARILLLEGGADHTFYSGKALRLAKVQEHEGCVRLIKWFECGLRISSIRKARAVVDAAESISKAPEKVGAKTEAEAQQAREEAAPAYLRGRVERQEALPSVEVVRAQQQSSKRRRKEEEEEEEEERRAVHEYVIHWLAEDLLTELMEGLRYAST